MENSDLLELTAQIVESHVASNRINAADVPALISSVHGALAGLGQPVETPVEEAKPAVSVRSSVKPDAITCLECGKKFKTIRRHIDNEHGMKPETYKSKWGLPDNYPMTAPAYTQQRSTLAKAYGLGSKGRGKGLSSRKPKGS